MSNRKELAGHLLEITPLPADQQQVLQNPNDRPETSQSGQLPENLVLAGNQTDRDYPRDATVHQLFEEQVRIRPTAVALLCDQDQVTYAELNRRANQLAHWLSSHGLHPGALAALALPRGIEQVTAVIAVLKLGAAYLPLDLADPRHRLAALLTDARPAVLLTMERLERRFRELAIDTVALDNAVVAAEIRTAPDTDLQESATPNSLGYVMVTSGSTGSPKGVMIPHRGVVRLVCGTDYVEFGPQRTFLQLAPTCFDASTFELWGALLHGARLVLAPEGSPDPDQVTALVEQHSVCTLWLTAGLFNTLVEIRPRLFQRLEQLIVGGEALSPHHVRLADSLLPPHARLVNGYGPTEGTTFTCCYTVPRPVPAGCDSIPIGRPIANTRVYVLDETHRPLGIGEPGELYIGGDGLALGYLNDPELTASRFIVNPVPGLRDSRLYRSGDRACWRSDGTLEFLSRLDDQVKIRGHRIEPAEVERALQSHPRVANAVVVVRTHGSGEKRLVAYYTLRADWPLTDLAQSADEPNTTELRAHLRNRLPEVMQPAALIKLAEMPLTSNGKVDRAALPPESYQSERGTTVSGLRTADQRAIASIIAEVLSITGVGAHDHFFFDLAGNSLLAAQVIDRVNRQFGVKLALQDLLTTPTVVSLAAKVAAQTVSAAVTPSYLEVIRQGGDRDPVVCVGFPNVLPALQARLAEDVPLWWLKLDGLHAPPYAIRTVPAIAASYFDEIIAAGARRVTLIGYSYGGLIAFELTRRLRSSGVTVNALLLEPSLPEMFARGHAGMPEDHVSNAPPAQPAWRNDGPIQQSGPNRMVSLGTRLAGMLKRRAQRSILRPYLQLTVGLGRELPARYREWWYYGSQIVRRVKQFEVVRAPGPYCVSGQVAYLQRYADDWRLHVDGEVQECPLPAARCHADVLEQPGAAPWLAVVRAWAEGTELSEPSRGESRGQGS